MAFRGRYLPMTKYVLILGTMCINGVTFFFLTFFSCVFLPPLKNSAKFSPYDKGEVGTIHILIANATSKLRCVGKYFPVARSDVVA